MGSRFRAVSATNTPNVVYFPLTDCTSLDINMTASAGTATLTIEGTVDGLNYITIDSLTAAAATPKHYGRDTTGASTALSPLSFELVRITAGTAGVGNTTTLTVHAV